MNYIYIYISINCTLERRSYSYFNVRSSLNDDLISPFQLLLKYENSLFRTGLKEKKNSKTSKLNFSENLSKKQLSINLSHLSFNSFITNMQIFPQQTIKCCWVSRLPRFRFKLLTHKINPFLPELYDPILWDVESYPLRRHR